jgi:Flp pilus assembly protein TadG
LLRRPQSVLHDATGSQIVEFAIALPLLMVLVVGIFDFGSAFNVKQKIVNAAREGARVASNQPTNDLWPPGVTGSCTAPTSVCAIRDAVDNALVTSNVSDCGLATANAASAGNLAWTFPANASCPGVPYLLKVERGVVLPAVVLPNPPFQSAYQIEATRVTITYPYRWTFNSVIQLLVSGSTYPATSQLTSVAVMQNLN